MIMHLLPQGSHMLLGHGLLGVGEIGPRDDLVQGHGGLGGVLSDNLEMTLGQGEV